MVLHRGECFSRLLKNALQSGNAYVTIGFMWRTNRAPWLPMLAPNRWFYIGENVSQDCSNMLSKVEMPMLRLDL